MGTFLFGSDADNTRRLKDEIANLSEKLKTANSSNWEMQQENIKLKEQLTAQAETIDDLSEKAARTDHLASELEKLRVEIKNANTRISELETATPATPVTPPPFRHEDEVVAETPARPEKPATAPHAAVDLAPLCERLECIEKFVDDNSYKDGIIKKLHSDLQERSGDFMAQIRRPYMKSVIRIHERLSNTLAACQAPEAMADPDALAKTIKKMHGDLLMVQDMLDDEYDLEYFRPEPGDKYDPRTHNALRSIPAPTPAQAGTIADCRLGGFTDQNSGKVVKAAMVTVYKSDK